MMLACAYKHRECPRSTAADLCHVDERSSEREYHPDPPATPVRDGVAMHYIRTISNKSLLTTDQEIGSEWHL